MDKALEHGMWSGAAPAPGASRKLQLAALLAITGLISVVFLGMVQQFMAAVILAAIFAVMADPLYQWFLRKVPGKSELASGLTLIVAIAIVVLPLVGIGILAAGQATSFAEAAITLVHNTSANSNLPALPDWVPFREQLQAAVPQIKLKAGEIVSTIAGYFVSSLSAVTRGTAAFLLHLFVFLYAIFVFLQWKISALLQVLSYTGLRPETQVLLSQRMVTVCRATIKGTVLIGMAQGALGGAGFWVAGIDGVAFWTVIIFLFSVIPAVGGTMVVIGGAIYLGIEGETAKAIGLALWGGVVVGNIDNLLRPILVGRDTAMNGVLILISTLGGISTFGPVGLVLGPVLAGLFVTVWDTLRDTISRANSEGLLEDMDDPVATLDQPKDEVGPVQR